ncbi:hypothetical protein [Poseidonocella sp. HB161398]|uniref:hypothetical protein n=1 Tax=Poseidonocella sp. HB161398 TaxID=2320855 RepID=UPI0011087D5C|nr:hypothetical protein [Poseidonocella sp. HB161398]
MTRCVHYVGFRDDRFLTAFRAFGGPVFIHRVWDRRAQRDIGDGDLVVFANGPADQPMKERNGDDIVEPAP